MNRSNENRREFLYRLPLAAGLVLPVLLSCKNETLAQKSSKDILDLMRKKANPAKDCNWCGAAREAPDDVSWKAVLADQTDEGEPLIMSGTVFEKDGKTPAPNVLIYAYHTNAKGFYGRGAKGEHPHGKHHGWMLTDARGRYEFRTIKPAQYPIRDTPAHIHYTLTGVDFKEYWIDDVWFEGDDLITPEIKRRQLTGRGVFNSVIKLEKGSDGILRGERDIQLQQIG